MRAYYIGENPDWVKKISEYLETEITAFSNPVRTILYINKHDRNENSPVYIFLESRNKEQDIQWLEATISSNLKDDYLILLTDKVVKEYVPQYLQAGANEVVDINTSAEDLRTILTLLPKLQQYQIVQKNSCPRRFKLPAWKRVFDIAFSSTALLCLSPLLLLTALAIRLESRGPIVYKSKRVGSNYDIFDFLKFRSMYMDADKRLKEFQALNQYREEHLETQSNTNNASATNSTTLLVADDFIATEQEILQNRRKQQKNAFVKFENDPRITRVGHFIRKYSIDELPQLINILKGDMSIVGNRPLPLYEAELLTTDEYVERFMAPAGLTGLWQVEKRGDQGALSAEERKQLDIKYARNFSFGTDLNIICRTFTAFEQKENV